MPAFSAPVPTLIRLIGVIPYRGSNVSHGTGVARVWEDHARYLKALARVLEARDRGTPTVAMGDYNQRLDGGRSSAPGHLRDRLRELLVELSLVNQHLTSERGYLLDHIAVDGLEPATSALIGSDRNGVRRSDHHGAWIDVS